MKRVLFFITLVSLTLVACNKSSDAVKPSWYPTTEAAYDNKLEIFAQFPIQQGDVVFAGDELIEYCRWAEFFGTANVKNRGIASEGVEGLRYRIESIASGKPAKLFIHTGYDDIIRGEKTPNNIYDAIMDIVKTAHKISPKTELYVINHIKIPGAESINEKVDIVNGLLKKANDYYTYVDITPLLYSGKSTLDRSYFDMDFVLNEFGFIVMTSAVRQYVDTAPEKLNSNQTVVMMGGDAMAAVDWNEFIGIDGIIDRAFENDDLARMAARLTIFTQRIPGKVFIMPSKKEIMTTETSVLWEQYKTFMSQFRNTFPNTQLYIVGNIPDNTESEIYDRGAYNTKLAEINRLFEASQEVENFLFLDPATVLAQEDGTLNPIYSYDGENLNILGQFTFVTMFLQGPRLISLAPVL